MFGVMQLFSYLANMSQLPHVSLSPPPSVVLLLLLDYLGNY